MRSLLAIVLLVLLAPSMYAIPLYLDVDTLGNSDENFNIDSLKTKIADSSIDARIIYGDGASFDEDNDGIESRMGVIDFSLIAPESKNPSCTRWEVFSIESASSQVQCHGVPLCCAALNLVPARHDPNEPLYLTYGKLGAEESNIVSAQRVELEGSDLLFSPWKSLDGTFKGEEKEEQSASKLLQEIKISNENVLDVSLVDSDGNEVSEKNQEQDLSLILEISSEETKEKDSASKEQPSTQVILEGFSISDALLENAPNLVVESADELLERKVSEAGIETVELVSIKNVDSVLDDSSYEGRVILPRPEEFSIVLFCPDDSIASCVSYSPCKELESACYSLNDTHISVFVPHFSSIILGSQNNTISLDISSPNNSTSAENVSLTLTSNLTLNVNYSLDSGQIRQLGNASSFQVALNGSLPYGVLRNGPHNITINVRDQFEGNASTIHLFYINDTSPPTIQFNISNNSALSSTYRELTVNITSTEYGNISYSLNNSAALQKNLDGNKHILLNLTPHIGINSLVLNVSDLLGNSRSYALNFTFFEVGLCTDALQNGNETGIDCGGACGSCVAFNASFDRPKYNTTDTPFISVVSRASSIVNVTLKRSGTVVYRYEFKPAFSGAPISETRSISNTSTIGNYTLNATMYYLNTTELITGVFEMGSQSGENSLAVTIGANATTLDENSEVKFGSEVSGNLTSVSYKWDFENDGTIESTLPNLTRRFERNGTFTVNLTITDSSGNKTDLETIIVRKLFNLSIKVRDNSTSSAVQNAKIEIDDNIQNSSGEGTARFALRKDSHDITITKAGYKEFTKEIDFSAPMEFIANLTSVDTTYPKVSLISPSDGEVLYNDTIEFVFTAEDNSQNSCTLYTRKDSVLWRAKESSSIESPSGQYSFKISEMDEGVHEWRVECRDRDSNINSTLPRSVNVSSERPNSLSMDLEGKDATDEELIEKIKQSIEALEELNGKESEIAEAILLKKNMEKAILAINRANRDLHSLEWRKLNESQLKIEEEGILKRAENVKYTTPISFELLLSSEFVSYPSKKDIEDALGILINSSNKKLSKKAYKQLVEENIALQKEMTITTKASVLELEYLSGEKRKFTLFRKKIDTSLTDFSPYVFYEVIPKDIAKDINDTEMLFEHTVIERDPIIEIDPSIIKEYSYLVKGESNLKEAEQISSILLKKEVSSKGGGFITGFSVFDSVTVSVRETVDVRLVAEGVIILILLGVYLVYSAGSLEQIKHRFESKQVREVRKIIEDARDSARGSGYEEASQKYRALVEKYKALDEQKRKELNAEVTEILSDVNVLYINKMLADADSAMERKEREKMASIYEKVRALYKIIPKEHKAKVLKKSMDLHAALSIPK